MRKSARRFEKEPDGNLLNEEFKVSNENRQLEVSTQVL